MSYFKPHSGIEKWPSEDLAGLGALSEVNLAYNKLTSVDAGDAWMAVHGGSIESLNVKGNKLTSFLPGAGSTKQVLVALEDLDLSYNSLTTVPPGLPSIVPGLRVLDLSFNPIQTISKGELDLPEYVEPFSYEVKWFK